MTTFSEHQFISHVVEDRKAISRLESDLQRLGFSPWVSHSQLPPRGGHRWEDLIRRAISEGIAFIACFSSAAAARERSYMRRELSVALEELQLRPRDRAWFFPVRLDDSEIPELPIGGGETLGKLQRIDLFPEWDVGVNYLAASLARPDERTETWLAQMVERFAAEPPKEQERWRQLLRRGAETGLVSVNVVQPLHDLALRLSHQGALADVGFAGAWHKFRLTQRGRMLLPRLLARCSVRPLRLRCAPTARPIGALTAASPPERARWGQALASPCRLRRRASFRSARAELAS